MSEPQIRPQSLWTSEDVEYLQANYQRLTYAQLACEMGRTAKSVQHKCLRLGLKLDSATMAARIKATRPDFSGSNNPNWKNGISTNHYHYKKLQMKRYPERVKARQLLGKAVADGIILRRPCQVCGELRVQAHHDDYSKPYDVRWFCREHHDDEHARIGKGRDMMSPEQQAA